MTNETKRAGLRPLISARLPWKDRAWPWKFKRALTVRLIKGSETLINLARLRILRRYVLADSGEKKPPNIDTKTMKFFCRLVDFLDNLKARSLNSILLNLTWMGSGGMPASLLSNKST